MPDETQDDIPCREKPSDACKLYFMEEIKKAVDGLASRHGNEIDDLKGRVSHGELLMMEVKTQFIDLKEFIRDSQKRMLSLTLVFIAGGFTLAGVVFAAILAYVFK